MLSRLDYLLGRGYQHPVVIRDTLVQVQRSHCVVAIMRGLAPALQSMVVKKAAIVADTDKTAAGTLADQLSLPFPNGARVGSDKDHESREDGKYGGETHLCGKKRVGRNAVMDERLLEVVGKEIIISSVRWCSQPVYIDFEAVVADVPRR